MSPEFVIFHIEGGLGKHIAATAILDGINKKYKDSKIIVVCGFPEIFLWNPLVHRTYAIGSTCYFYDDYILNKDTVILKHNPYDNTNHIHQKQSLIKSWYEVFDLEYEGQLPKIYSNFKFEEIALSNFYRDKPILLLHTNGGPYNNNDSYDKNYYNSWSRDMPFKISNEIVQTYSKDYHIIQVCKSKNNAVQGTEVITGQTYNQELINILRLSEKRILIDSCLQHAAAALGLPSTVLWIGTNPKVFGYDIHTNIIAKKEHISNHKNIKAYLYDYELFGDPLQCPFPNNDLFDISDIVNSLQ